MITLMQHDLKHGSLVMSTFFVQTALCQSEDRWAGSSDECCCSSCSSGPCTTHSSAGDSRCRTGQCHPDTAHASHMQLAMLASSKSRSLLFLVGLGLSQRLSIHFCDDLFRPVQLCLSKDCETNRVHMQCSCRQVCVIVLTASHQHAAMQL